jgi:hypothetical protein
MVVEKIDANKPVPNRAEHTISYQNWVDAPNVEAGFAIRHDTTSIHLFYQVEEPQVRAVNTAYNSSVWEDSCVEFFIALDGDSSYYNFEINAIGTVLGAYGPDRHLRSHLPGSLLSQVKTSPSLGHDPIENINQTTRWNMKVVIPIKVLQYTTLNNLSGAEGRGNFYKCGDRLEHPHYLSWKPVLTSSPDFHTPRYFGQLSFR